MTRPAHMLPAHIRADRSSALDPAGRFACGAISASILPGGSGLRDIAAGDEIVLRGLGFVARDEHWGTHKLAPRWSLEPDGGATVFIASGDISAGPGDLQWRIRIRMGSDGIDAVLAATSRGGFLTNRTGLVVLHSLAASRGRAVRVGHADGTAHDGAFPDLVAPHQPFHDVASLAYRTCGGVDVALAFEGAEFETEDQRNWTDASFKTYSRPLALPFPYRIPPGAIERQRVSATFSGAAPSAAVAVARPVIRACAPLPLLAPGPGLQGNPGPFARRNRLITNDECWTWACSPTVHADDDDTIGESTEALPDLVGTAKARARSCRIEVQPARLRAGPARDRRQGTIIEAAWALATISGLLDASVQRVGFPEPEGAAAELLARLRPLEGAAARSIAWPGLPRLRGLILPERHGSALAVAHVRDAPVTLPLPAGAWRRVELLGPLGFSAPVAAGPDLTLAGFSVAWLSSDRQPYEVDMEEDACPF